MSVEGFVRLLRALTLSELSDNVINIDVNRLTTDHTRSNSSTAPTAPRSILRRPRTESGLTQDSQASLPTPSSVSQSHAQPSNGTPHSRSVRLDWHPRMIEQRLTNGTIFTVYSTLQVNRHFPTLDHYLSPGNHRLREMTDKEYSKMSACTIIAQVPMVYLVWINPLRPLKTCLRLFKDVVSGSR